MRKRKVLTGMLMLFLILMVAACGDTKSGSYVMGQHYYNGGDKSTEEVEDTETEVDASSEGETVSDDLLLIMKNDMTAEMMILKQLSSGKQYMYYYSTGTKFLDKYGNHTSVSNFDTGKVVTIGTKTSDGKLSSMQISDEVWEYDAITKYAVDEENSIFSIAGTKYTYDSELLVCSDEDVITLVDLTDLDELRVVGIGKKIYSVSVTTGHGTLSLENTEIFEGSYIQIGTKIFSEITENMQMELSEGTYTVTVANDGYGGSTDITVERGQTVSLDLDTLKGEGPKYGNIQFAITTVGAVLYVDGEQMDYSQPISLKYGVHAISVSVEGYDTWSKNLYVNSSEATIIIDPTDTDTDTDTDTETTDSSTIDSSTTDSSTTDSSTTDSTTTDSTTTDDTTTDYLSTLSELLSSIT